MIFYLKEHAKNDVRVLLLLLFSLRHSILCSYLHVVIFIVALMLLPDLFSFVLDLPE